VTSLQWNVKWAKSVKSVCMHLRVCAMEEKCTYVCVCDWVYECVCVGVIVCGWVGVCVLYVYVSKWERQSLCLG
jgi:hypothetical protein